MYDAYSVMAERAGAVVVPVKLNENDWSIPKDGLEAAFSDRTKLVLVNTPHNPTGKVRLSSIASPFHTLMLHCICLSSMTDLKYDSL